MKFKFKVFNPDSNGTFDKSKFTLDEMVAANEDEFMQACTMLGQKVEIIERLGSPEKSNLAGPAQPPMAPLTPEEIAMGKIPTPPGIAPFRSAGETIPVPGMRPPVVEFEDNGIKFKVEGGSVFKKDWVDVKAEEYRVVERSSGRTLGVEGMVDLKVQRLDWVKVK